MRKKTDVDIYEELSKLVDTHVKHYKEDFDLDQRLIMQAAKSELPEDRTLIWFCRECGTHCLRESQAFVRDTREHTTLRFYAEQSGEAITARIIVPKFVKGKKVMGDVYEVNFRDLANKVAQESISPAMTRMAFADGFEQEVPFHKSLRQAEVLVQEHGKITSLHVIPVDKEALADLLEQQKHRRERFPEAASEEKLPSLPVTDYRKYEAIKQDHPDALVCFAQHDYFELYGDDAKKAAPLLSAKLLDKKIRGQPPLPVTGFKQELWVAASKKLWKAGHDVLLVKDDAAGRNRYLGYLMSLALCSFRNMRVGLDCANGSAWMIAKNVFDALGAKTYVINNEPDGTNINTNCGSTHIQGLQALVKEKHLDVGFAFDGDADRCLCVDGP